jgi:hypothetical protein
MQQQPHYYNRQHIRKMIESLATVYNIPAERWYLTFGTAMVVHGLNTSTSDVDITLSEDDWKIMAKYHEVNTDTLGPIIELPGKVEIRPMETLMSDHVWTRLNHTMVPTKQSLHSAYTWLIENPIPGRDKLDADLKNLNKLDVVLESDKNEIEKQITQVLSTVMSDAVSMVIQLESSKLFELIGDDVHRTTIKDDSNDKWGVKVHPKAKSVEFWEINEIDMHGNVEIHSIRFDKQVGKVS